jgi:hypothetical protein
MSRRFSLVFLIVMSTALNSSAKRVAPRPVHPVVCDGIEYSATGDGKSGYVVAKELPTGNKLWIVRVFKIHTHWWNGEEDNQWVFISDMKLAENALLIRDERARCYRLDFANRRIRKERCP